MSAERRNLPAVVEAPRKTPALREAMLVPTSPPMHENWLEATRYLNMEHLREHKKETPRALAA